MKRERPRLTNDAFSSIFPNIPACLSSSAPPQRTDPAARCQRQEQRAEEAFADWMAADRIEEFTTILDGFQQRLSEQLVTSWQWKVTDKSQCFYTVDLDEKPSIASCIKIHSNLQGFVYIDGIQEHRSWLLWILGSDSILSKWSQLENLLSHYKMSRKAVRDDLTLEETIKLICAMVTDKLKNADSDVEGCDDDDNDDNSFNIGTVKFCVEQLKLSCGSPYGRRYSNNMLRFEFTLFVYSFSCYRILSIARQLFCHSLGIYRSSLQC